MNASKENANEAAHRLSDIEMAFKDVETGAVQGIAFLRDFIDAAGRKLPSEATYAKEKARKRPKRISCA